MASQSIDRVLVRLMQQYAGVSRTVVEQQLWDEVLLLDSLGRADLSAALERALRIEMSNDEMNVFFALENWDQVIPYLKSLAGASRPAA